MNLPSKIFITGTDTGVGKTVVTASLAHCLSKAGKKVSVVKPVQTGTAVQKVSDIEFVYKVLDKDYNYEDHCPYSFSEPLSPKTASDLEYRLIDTNKICKTVNKQREVNDIVLIEGAGGLLVPLNADYFMADLAKDLNCSLIIVIRPGLGTINHTILTVEAALIRSLKILGIVISNFPDDPNTSERTNPEEIVDLCGVPIVGVISEDGKVDVDNGQIGEIRKNAPNSFISRIGGSLDMAGFIDSLKL